MSRAATNRYIRKRYQERKSNDLCITCGKKVENRTICKKCCQKQAARRKNRFKVQIRKGEFNAGSLMGLAIGICTIICLWCLWKMFSSSGLWQNLMGTVENTASGVMNSSALK